MCRVEGCPTARNLPPPPAPIHLVRLVDVLRLKHPLHEPLEALIADEEITAIVYHPLRPVSTAVADTDIIYFSATLRALHLL